MTNISDHIQYSQIRDIVNLLDSDDTMKGNELVPAYRAMQIANRAFPAHQAIETGLKARLTKANLTFPKTGKKGHDLGDLYNRTKKRGGLVCLNSAARFDKWNRAAVR